MAWAVLRLRHKTSAWASWLLHWPNCQATFMCEISHGDSIGLLIGFDSRFRIFFVFLDTAQKFEAGQWLFLIGLTFPTGGGWQSPRTAHQIPQISF
jgi:hypothetical protein